MLSGLFINEPTLDRICKQFSTEMDLSLNERFEESSILMENTYIPELPDGTGAVHIMKLYLNEKLKKNLIFFKKMENFWRSIWVERTSV